MARFTCTRCGAITHSTGADGGAHLCKDIAGRLDRATKITTRVGAILAKHGVADADGAIALDIFKAVSGFTFD